MQIGGITWDSQGYHYYYTGIDAVALYVWDERITPTGSTTNPTGWYGKGVNWDGVTSLNESPSGAESNKLYADNLEYLNLLSKEEFGLTLESYQVPEMFDECDGISALGAMKVRGQSRKQFALVYRVQKGSDTVQAGDMGYVYHVVYGCKASPSSRDFATVNDSPEAQTFSYEISTTPITDSNLFGAFASDGVTSIIHLEIDSNDLSSGGEATLQTALYGKAYTVTEGGESVTYYRCPTPAEILTACAD